MATFAELKRDVVMKRNNLKLNPLGCVKCTEGSISLSFADLAKVTHANGLNILWL